MITFNTKPIDEHSPIWEIKVDHLIDEDFLKTKDMWGENVFDEENGGLYQQPTRCNYVEQNLNQEDRKIIDNFIEQFKEPQMIDLLVDIFEDNNKIFYRNYPYKKHIYKNNRDFLTDFIDVCPTVLKDKPTFKLNHHFDNRFVFGNLILNLTDNDTSTKFYRRRNRDLLWEGPTKKGEGFIFLNTETTEHDYHNNTKNDRYVFIANIGIKYYNLKKYE
jgi:hypothetical protein